MEIGDFVENGQGHRGIVTAIVCASPNFKSRDESPNLNPDIYVVTVNGKRIWSYKALKIISKVR